MTKQDLVDILVK